MKVAILVCAMAAAALAAPRYNRAKRLDIKLSEHVKAAEHAWTTAEREPDPANQSPLWEQAADAFAEVDNDPLAANDKRAAAYAAVLAWKNSLAVDLRVATPSLKDSDEQVKPRPLPARDLKFVAAIDRYIKYADPNDPDLPGLVFLKARTFSRYDQPEAIPLYRILIDRYPQHEVSGYAAQFLLDAYNRLRNYDQLIAFADELAKHATFLRGRTELAATVTAIQRQAARKRVERLEVEARAETDLDKHSAVGTAYLAIYNLPRVPGGEDVLYNAGVAFEYAREPASAIQAFALLLRNHPTSKLAPRTTARLAHLYANLAMLDKAADQLEQYAMKYAGEKDAYQAMSDAVYYRKALGDRDKAIADTNYFIRTFGPKRPREAADAMWSLTALYETTDPTRAIEHLRSYLLTYGTKGGPDRVIIAHAKIGQLLWKQSCPLPGVDGLCMKTISTAARTCGAGTTRTLATSTRDQPKVRQALVAVASAIREYERTRATDGAARYFYAQAKLVLADAELEPYVALAYPRALDFDPKRFDGWIAQKQRAAAKLRRDYEAILAIKDAATTITAIARMGIVAQSFASSLVTAEIPRDMRTNPDKRNAYCDGMTSVAQPLEATAVIGFEVCLAKSTELGWFGESSRHCERELTVMKPADFPRATELRIQPLLVAPIIAVESP